VRLITDQDEIIANFVSQGVGRKIHPPYTAMGWVDIDPVGNWRLVSGAVFNDYTGSSIEISIYGRMTRQTMREAFRYVFLQLGCLRLTARTRRNNTRIKKMLPRMGFVLEGSLKRFFGSAESHTALIYRLDADEAQRWIHGQRSTAT